jgi:hypothetical protein
VDDNVPYNEELENEIGSQIIELQMAGKAIVKELDGAVIAVYAAANYYIELNSAGAKHRDDSPRLLIRGDT